MSRLTLSLLTLARVEALGTGEVEVVDIASAVRDVVAAVEVPVGLELRSDVEPDSRDVIHVLTPQPLRLRPFAT